jgi:hypothetical protein
MSAGLRKRNFCDEGGQAEVEGAQAEDREDVAREDDEGSGVIAKIAGIESTAKTRSVISTMMQREEEGRDCPGGAERAGGRRVLHFLAGGGVVE